MGFLGCHVSASCVVHWSHCCCRHRATRRGSAGDGAGGCWGPGYRAVCGSGFGNVGFVSLVTEGDRLLVWLGGDGASSEGESRRLLGIRRFMSLFSALAILRSNEDMNWRCMTGVMLSLMVVFSRAVRSAVCLII